MIKNTILQGGCLKILKTLSDKSIDLIFAEIRENFRNFIINK